MKTVFKVRCDLLFFIYTVFERISANYFQGAFLVAASYCGCGQEFLAVIFLTVAQGFSGFCYGGIIVNHVDIAPKYAGTLFEITNAAAAIPGFVAPSVAAALTPNVRKSFLVAS